MSKIKVFCFTGTRADYPRIRPVLDKIHLRCDEFNLSLIVTGQHLLKSRGFSKQDVEKDPFNIIAEVPMFEENKDTIVDNARAYAKCVSGMVDFLSSNRPDVALVTVDRVETLAIATACRVLDIPICHIQGGEISGTQDEVFRHAVTKLSDVHCVATKLSADRLLAMGENPACVFNTGCPYIEFIEGDLPKPNLADKKHYFLFCLHSNLANPKEREAIPTLFDALKQNFENEHIIAILPNTDPGYRLVLSYLNNFQKTQVINNLPHHEYLSLLRDCQGLIGNTSSGIREAPSFGIPFLCFGSRQEGRERGKNVIDLGVDPSLIKQWLSPIKISELKSKLSDNCHNPYRGKNASDKICEALKFTYMNQDLIADKKFNHNSVSWK